MEITEQIAEFYGALLGDGCLTKYKNSYDNRIRHCVKLTGHTHDRQYYEEILIPAIQSTFGINGYLQNRPKYNAITYDIISKRVFDFFAYHGMPSGKKNELRIPAEILKDRKIAISCIRGLFNTDGSIYRRYNKKYKGHANLYNHLVVQFKINSTVLLEQIKVILESCEIRTNNITKSGDAFALRITHQPSVRVFMALINTKHGYHAERYLNTLKEPSLHGLVAQPG